MTRRERRVLFGGTIALAIVCSALFARAVLAQRAADYAHAQARAAILPSPAVPRPDFADRTMLSWSGATGQVRYWQALQRFRIVAARATEATQVTVGPTYGLLFSLEETETYLHQAAVEAGTSAIRSRLYDMLGLAYYADALLHAGPGPVEPALEAKSIGSFRQAVLVDGANEAAKTNLEVLLRKQLSHKHPKTKGAKAVPDTTRSAGGPQGANGLPAENGAIGKKFRGGF